MQGNFFTVAGRLQPGVSVESGTAQLASARAEFAQAFPQALPPQVGFGVQTLQEMIVRNVRSSLWILVGAVSFVLLIACANVANLLLVRATVRQREIAIRSAIGATRSRIARQLMTESMVLSLLGGLFGLALGVIGIRALLALNPGNIPRVGINGDAVGVDLRALVFTAIVSIVTGLVFGLFPALRAARVDLSTTMKENAGLVGHRVQTKQDARDSGGQRSGPRLDSAGRRGAADSHLHRPSCRRTCNSMHSACSRCGCR